MDRKLLLRRGYFIHGGGVAASGDVTPWYQAGGIALADVVAAYQPKGAASLAASYVNLALPGTNNATGATPPTWNATDGWIFNGTTQSLTACADSTNMSTFIRFTNSVGALYGCASGAGYYGISANTNSPSFWSTNNVASDYTFADNGILGMSGANGYQNLILGKTGLTSPHTVSGTIKIGALDTFLAASKIQAFIAINRVLTASEITAIVTAMQAL